MASIRQIAEISGFHRDSIKARITRFGLKPPYSGRDIFTLRALDDTNRDNTTLEQARTRESIAKAQKYEIEVATLQRERLPAKEVEAAFAQSLGPMRSIVEASALSRKEKDDMIDAMRDVPRKLGWEPPG